MDGFFASPPPVAPAPAPAPAAEPGFSLVDSTGVSSQAGPPVPSPLQVAAESAVSFQPQLPAPPAPPQQAIPVSTSAGGLVAPPVAPPPSPVPLVNPAPTTFVPEQPPRPSMPPATTTSAPPRAGAEDSTPDSSFLADLLLHVLDRGC